MAAAACSTLFFSTLLGCGDKKDAAKKEGGAGGPAPSVVVITVEQKTIPVLNEYIGRLWAAKLSISWRASRDS